MSPTEPLPIRLAQTLGLSTSLLVGGANIALSTFLIPRILEAPTPLLLRQWLHMFESGKRSIPPLALLSACSYFSLAYQSSHSPSLAAGGKVGRYVVSGLLAAGIVPWTVAFMSATNKKLIDKAESVKGFKDGETVTEIGLGEETAHRLVDWWGVLNLGRGAMLAASGVLGVWTVLN